MVAIGSATRLRCNAKILPMKLLRFAVAIFSLLLPYTAFAQSVEIEPGVVLKSLITVVEHPDGGELTSEAMHASKVSANTHTGSNAARNLVYAGQQHTIEVSGITSTLHTSTAKPVFYIRLDPEDPNSPTDEVTLVRLRPTKETRIVLSFTLNSFGGGRKRHMEEVPITKEDVGKTVLRVTPQAPLDPGEYAIVFLPGDKATYADRVYDFTVPAK
jgi:hypothetical protein